MTNQTQTILYFVEGEHPTNEEFAKAEQYMAKGPMFEFVSVGSLDYSKPLIPATHVAGKVPDAYKEAYTVLDAPTAKKAKVSAAE